MYVCLKFLVHTVQLEYAHIPVFLYVEYAYIQLLVHIIVYFVNAYECIYGYYGF